MHEQSSDRLSFFAAAAPSCELVRSFTHWRNSLFVSLHIRFSYFGVRFVAIGCQYQMLNARTLVQNDSVWRIYGMAYAYAPMHQAPCSPLHYIVAPYFYDRAKCILIFALQSDFTRFILYFCNTLTGRIVVSCPRSACERYLLYTRRVSIHTQHTRCTHTFLSHFTYENSSILCALNPRRLAAATTTN